MAGSSAHPRAVWRKTRRVRCYSNPRRAEFFSPPVVPTVIPGNPLRLGQKRLQCCLVDRGGTRDITRSFNTFSTTKSSKREAHLTDLVSGAICVPLWRFYQQGSLNRVNRH